MTTVLAHPKYQLLPAPPPADETRLRESILEARGLWPGYEIDVDEDGEVLDGHTRDRICRELGFPAPRRVRHDLLTEDAKFDFIIKVNMARRHLSIEQKRELTRAYLLRFPEKSNRKIAEATGLSDPTVGKVRDAMEDAGEIETIIHPHTPTASAKASQTARQSYQEPRDEDEGDDGQPYEPTDTAEHLGPAHMTITVTFPVRSDEERQRGPLPYTREAETFTKEIDGIVPAQYRHDDVAVSDFHQLMKFLSDTASAVYYDDEVREAWLKVPVPDPTESAQWVDPEAQ